MGRSLREYVRRVFLTWWAAVGLVATVLGIAALFVNGGVTLPLWLGLAIAAVCLVIAQFGAFHQVRAERDRSPQGPTTLGGIAVHANTVQINYYNQPPPEGE